MSGPIVIQVEDLWKEYRLGAISHGTLKADLASWWNRRRGKEDPNVKVGGSATALDGKEVEDRFWALQEVSFEVRQGEVLGIIGSNGAGKSTLLKILSRVTTPSRGRIKVKGRVASLLEVGTGFHPELTGRENVFLNGAILGMRREEISRKFDEIVDFAGIGKFADTPVKRYSSGMYVRLAFAVAAHLEPDVLVIDEVLAVGDAEFQRRCLGKMDEVTKAGRTILFVSHNLSAVQRLCGRSLWMRGGRSFDFGPSDELISRYLHHQTAGMVRGQVAPGVLYLRPGPGDGEEISLNRLELQSPCGVPKRDIHTWDAVRLRVEFTSRRRYASMSVVIQIATVDGAVLVLTSTTPDRTRSFCVEPGCYTIDCDFQEFPLAAGEYIIGIGLVIPGIEYLWRKDDVCRLEVLPKDVYRSGLAPSANRYHIATRHEWGELKAADSMSHAVPQVLWRD